MFWIWSFWVLVSSCTQFNLVQLETPLESFKLTYPSQLPVSASADATLHVKLTLSEPARAVFFVLESASASYTVLCTHAADSLYKAKNLKDTATLAALNHSPGSYQLHAYAIGKDVKDSSFYDLGNMSLWFTAKKPSLTSAQDMVFEKLPSIAHVFAKQEPLPPVILSWIFTGLILGLWIPLGQFYYKHGANISQLYANRQNTLWGTLFLGALGASVALLFAYWVKLNIFQFLGCASGLSVVTAFLGRQALMYRSAFRLKQA